MSKYKVHPRFLALFGALSLIGCATTTQVWGAYTPGDEVSPLWQLLSQDCQVFQAWTPSLHQNLYFRRDRRRLFQRGAYRPAVGTLAVGFYGSTLDDVAPSYTFLDASTVASTLTCGLTAASVFAQSYPFVLGRPIGAFDQFGHRWHRERFHHHFAATGPRAILAMHPPVERPVTERAPVVHPVVERPPVAPPRVERVPVPAPAPPPRMVAPAPAPPPPAARSPASPSGRNQRWRARAV